MKEIIILGAGDFGREVAGLIEEINKISPSYTIVGYLDDDTEKIGQKILAEEIYAVKPGEKITVEGRASIMRIRAKKVD